MTTQVLEKEQISLLTGNSAVAHAARLCRPDIIAAYPITPQTSVVEQLARFRTDGLLDADMVEVESEHSALSVLIGASAAGARTFTATSSQGLFFMFEPYIRAAALRLPIVMAIVTRESDPAVVTSSHQDAILVRDAGWIQIFAENCQEILDSTIMAFRLAEDPEILLPVNIVFDGFYLSHLAESVRVPDQEQIDRFLPSREAGLYRLDPDVPKLFPGMVTSDGSLTEYRHKHCDALGRAKQKIDTLDEELGQIIGRSYGGLIEEYRTEDAELLLVVMGSYAGTAKAVVNGERAKGVKVGLVKVRTLRPFPKERLSRALAGKKAIGVIDRNVCFGWNSGTLFMEVKAALCGVHGLGALLGFVVGLGGSDITKEHIGRAVDCLQQVAGGAQYQETTWLTIE